MSSLIGKLETDMELNASAGRFMICSATGLPKFPRLLMIRYEHVLYMKVNGAKEGFIISWNYDHEWLNGLKSITSRVIEGDLLKDFKSVVFKSQVSPKSQDCILHWTLEYEKLHEGIPNPQTMLRFVIQICKDMDSHIIQGN
ncbi:hypothetical protein E1A91_D01G178000v1 [Gossypium mustelinum]|uniref:Bet v I/Major latex protein domain-containing protein n=1 Tax=Gossypium mustelinum TaxID=34275 RepID=A0A5D2WAN7_GOSMU|nr:hypothetical protein E1A91_D01G178000v1 [Gossypium mustelinum]